MNNPEFRAFCLIHGGNPTARKQAANFNSGSGRTRALTLSFGISPVGGPAQLARTSLERIGSHIPPHLAYQHATTLRDLWTNLPTYGALIPLMDQIKWRQPFRYHPREYMYWVVADAADLFWSSLRVGQLRALPQVIIHDLDRADALSQRFAATLVRYEPSQVTVIATHKAAITEFLLYVRDVPVREVYLGQPIPELEAHTPTPLTHHEDSSTLDTRRQIPRRLAQARSKRKPQMLLRELQQAASIYTIGGFYEAAEHCLDEGIPLAEQLKDHGGLFKLWANRFLIAFASRDGREAARAVAKLCEILPKSRAPRHEAWVCYFQAMLWLRLSQPTEPAAANKRLRHALSLTKKINDTLLQAFLYNAQGLAYHQLGDVQKAEAACREAIRLISNDMMNPRARIEYATFLYNLGQLELSRGNIESALRYLDEVQAIEGDLPYYHGERGRFLMLAGDMEQAERSLVQAISSGVPSPELLCNLALVQAALAKRQEALSTLEMLRVRFPDYPEGFVNAAAIYLEDGNFEAAASLLTQGRMWHNDNPELLCNLGYLAYCSDQLKQAEEIYNEVLQLSPTLSDAWVNLAAVQLDRGNLVGAKNSLIQALQLRPNDVDILDKLAYLEERITLAT